jgi:hypothetical protein
MRLNRLLAVVIALLVLGGVGFGNASMSGADPQGKGVVRTPGGDVPYYARTDFLFHNDEWAVIVFYRPPECVPPSFNLLQFYDIPGAFFCTPTTTAGWNMWENGPGVDPAPFRSQLQGLGAVPVWLVGWPEMQAAAQDGVLTMSELQAMASLVRGSAFVFNESLIIPRKLTFVAIGVLQDGRRFHIEATSFPAMTVMNVTVVLR